MSRSLGQPLRTTRKGINGASWNGPRAEALRDEITCPDCGLVLTSVFEDPGYKLSYDIDEWRRRCKRPTWTALCGAL